MAKFDWFDGKVTQVIEETPNIKRFYIKVPRSVEFNFKAGQFVMLDLPIQSKKTTRQYSVASYSKKRHEFELIIVLDPKGQATNYLFSNVHEGSTVKTSTSLGKFALPEYIDKEICFICTGVGIAPFKAMLQEIYENRLPHKEINMIFGTRTTEDLCYHKELKELEAEHPEFRFHPVLSREMNHGWNGFKGYVHDVYKQLYADKRPAYFYICGWKKMIMQAKANLIEMGYDAKDVKYELYD